MTEESKPTLAHAITEFLADLPPERRQASQQELNRFMRWYGGARTLAELGPQDVEAYAEGIGTSAPDPTKRLEPLKEFLACAKKKGLTTANLGIHLRLSKGTQKKPTVRHHHRTRTEKVELTNEGLTGLREELETLKRERPRVVEEIRRAAADKDVRENAPLEAARERHGQIEGRIRELEATLQTASLLQERDGATPAGRALAADLGYTVTLRDLASDREVRYKLVNPREANPTTGKLSIQSPVGQALVNRGPGDIVSVTAPRGTLRYRIEKIER